MVPSLRKPAIVCLCQLSITINNVSAVWIYHEYSVADTELGTFHSFFSFNLIQRKFSVKLPHFSVPRYQESTCSDLFTFQVSPSPFQNGKDKHFISLSEGKIPNIMGSHI